MRANSAYATEISASESSPRTSSIARTATSARSGAERFVRQSPPVDTIDPTELVELYLPLVRNVVERIKLTLPPHVDVDDLHSVGVTGLIAAVARFTPEQGNTFAGYATTRIRGAILDELRRLDWCPRRIRTRTKKLKESISTVEQTLGRAATDEEMSTHLGVSRREYAKWVEETKPVRFVPIDQPVETSESEGASLHDIIPDDHTLSVHEMLENVEVREILAERITELPEMQRKILAMYYYEDMRLAEIAEVFDLTESRICQIHAQTVAGLRTYILRARNR